MHCLSSRCCWLVLSAAAALPAAAQPAPSRPDPTDPAAATAPLSHRSALAGYRRSADAPTLDWRSANDQVERIGGWRAYAREAAAPAPAASATPAPAATPAPRSQRPAAPAPAHRH
jgi:hypothetical protein